MKIKTVLFLIFILPTTGLFAQPAVTMNNYTADPLACSPDRVAGTGQCRVSLNGAWEFSMKPEENFWLDHTPGSKWKPVQVPGECRMQGFPVEHDVEYAYRKNITIPESAGNNIVVLRFTGTYSYARIWINGKYVRDHHGGFTSWDCDITKLVEPGKTAVLTVGITDRSDEISFASGYAKHPVGGILRSVELIVLPAVHLRNLYLEPRFDAAYRNAWLKISASLSLPAEAVLELKLTDPSGNAVDINPAAIQFDGSRQTGMTEIPVFSPLKWDAEHPVLYTIQARLLIGGKEAEMVSEKVGFREIRIIGTQIFVNGFPVKLRGACRHDIHPLLGRSTTPELDKQDVLLAKDANFNYIRTSHYPPSRDFLEYCDQYGIYVEEETAVCFVGNFRDGIYKPVGGSHDDPAFADRYLSQLSEMIDRDRNHPSVIIWSIGNESQYGSNFDKQFRFVKSVDLSRPVMCSWPGTVPQGVYGYDIYSDHYPSFDKWLAFTGKDSAAITWPVISDEWMHVACYNLQDLRTDPNVRNAWGESLKRAWENSFESELSSGGAIWGMVDETFMLPDTCVGYGEWGIIDTWRRPKPEFWHTKKAYSPVRVLATRFPDYTKGSDLPVPVYNRFDHTNLNEITLICTAGEEKSTIKLPDIKPHSKGVLLVPAALVTGKPLHITFFGRDERIIDEEILSFGPVEAKQPAVARAINPGSGPVTSETRDKLIVSGKSFTLTFNKKTGLIESGTLNNRKLIESGPRLRLTGPVKALTWNVDTIADLTHGKWLAERVEIANIENQFVVSTIGMAGDIKVKYLFLISGDGEITIRYSIENLPEKIQEAGLVMALSKDLNRLAWKRKALWSVYPDDHIGRPEGQSDKTVLKSVAEAYRQKPVDSWSQDTRNWYLFRATGGNQPSGLPVPNDFRSLKENILQYILTSKDGRTGLEVLSDGRVAARSEVLGDGSVNLIINNEWTYRNLEWGNYERPVNIKNGYSGEINMRLGIRD